MQSTDSLDLDNFLESINNKTLPNAKSKNITNHYSL